MKLVVGLGNIGTKYVKTRHNVGFMVVNELAKRHNADWQLEPKLKAEIASIELDGEEIVLAKPQTMMNLSGDAVGKLISNYRSAGLGPSRMWVIHDDIDLADGIVRMKIGGSAGGQLGVQSIIERVGTEFHRVRVGIGRNDRDSEPAELYVMKPLGKEATKLVLQSEPTIQRIERYIKTSQQE